MNIAIILAAGKSERLKEIAVPKQLYLINRVPLFMYSVLTFNDLEEIDEIYLVTNEQCLSEIEQYVKQYSLTKKVKGLILGGRTRQESVYLALKHLEKIAKDDDIILIHDSARPLLEKETILKNIENTVRYGAVTTAIKVKDTIFSESEDGVDHIVSRSRLYQAQTPQSFKYCLIKKAHESAVLNNVFASDDSALIKEIGYDVKIVLGTTTNFKITTIEDIKLLEMMVL
ncbi:MAG TPA: 2-C-methyl-D-erythritol 4-phosphate cytidylyltransferase [Erysipelotrichaceae bacterium]|nr:2-C-methyl-D-erythritol 4-phosphate cytidylyltransferase [Erysipelotrichaceae bacterium]